MWIVHAEIFLNNLRIPAVTEDKKVTLGTDVAPKKTEEIKSYLNLGKNR